MGLSQEDTRRLALSVLGAGLTALGGFVVARALEIPVGGERLVTAVVGIAGFFIIWNLDSLSQWMKDHPRAGATAFATLALMLGLALLRLARDTHLSSIPTPQSSTATPSAINSTAQPATATPSLQPTATESPTSTATVPSPEASDTPLPRPTFTQVPIAVETATATLAVQPTQTATPTTHPLPSPVAPTPSPTFTRRP